jgi:V/A-type H+-transporting ATPase subunit I
MAKVELFGPRRLLPEAIGVLQAEGALELRPVSRDGPLRPVALAPDEAAERARFGESLRKIEGLIAILPLDPDATPRPLPPPTDAAFSEAIAALEAERSAIEARRAALVEERAEAARLARILGALAPLYAAGAPLSRARAFGIALRRDRPEALDVLEQEVSRLTDAAFDLRWRDAGEDRVVLLTVPQARVPAVSALLFEHGVGEVSIPSRYAGQLPARAALSLLVREREIGSELHALEEEASRGGAAARAALERARDDLASRAERLDAVSGCGATDHAFVVAGWVPRKRVERLAATLREKFGGAAEIVEVPIGRGEHETVPVVLSNPWWLQPFELLLGLVPLPRYGSVDPTPYLAIFFPLMFGLVLGDIAFGIIGASVAVLAIVRGWGGALGRRVALVALACAAWAALFGVLFGEFLGEVGAHLGLHPVLMDRRRAIGAFFGVAIAAGFLHLSVGLVLGLVGAIRERHLREIVARASRLGVLAGAIPLAAILAGLLSRDALVPAGAVVGASALAGVLAEGPLALLDVLLAVGNILSYARLMALGLASLMLAEAANIIAGALPGAPGIALAVLLHGVNFTLGLISPAIAALRLQYVEFFEKFYREGGRPFRPFVVTA